MNNKLLFSSNIHTWETPQDLFDKLNHKYNFTLDVCATKDNAKCERFYSPEIDGLKQTWIGMCWMNPPYEKGVQSKWIEKAYNESLTGNCEVLALLPARTDTKMFHKFIYRKKTVSIDFLEGRLKFGNSLNAAPFPSMLVLFSNQLTLF